MKIERPMRKVRDEKHNERFIIIDGEVFLNLSGDAGIPILGRFLRSAEPDPRVRIR